MAAAEKDRHILSSFLKRQAELTISSQRKKTARILRDVSSSTGKGRKTEVDLGGRQEIEAFCFCYSVLYELTENAALSVSCLETGLPASSLMNSGMRSGE